MDFSESVVVYDIKVWLIQSTKFVHEPLWISMVNVIHWSSSKVTQIQHFQTSFPQKLLAADWSQISYGTSMGCGERKCVQMFQVTWPIPYTVRNFKNRLLWRQEADDLETWYIASSTRVLSVFSNVVPGLTVTIFKTGSNLFPNASAWVKAYTTCISKFVLIQHILSA